MKKYTSKTNEQKKQELDELSKKLVQGIKGYLESDNFKELLNNMNKFHSYSLQNCLLIGLQCPNASLVTTYPKWRKLNKQVKKGEHGIKIFVPIRKVLNIETRQKDENGNVLKDEFGNEIVHTEQKTYVNFKIGHVFDVSQTEQMEGKEEVILSPVKMLKEDVDNFDTMFNILKSVSPVEVRIEKIENPANGYYSDLEKLIVVDEGMSPSQTIKTTIHEIAHSILHKDGNKEYSRNVKELQAESVAYIVCQHLGIETSDYSFGYVGTWMEQEEQLLENLKVIKNCSSYIIDRIDSQLKNLH